MWAVKKTLPTIKDYKRIENPIFYLSHSEEDAKRQRDFLELHMAKAFPIEFYFDPKDYVCYEELSRLDRYLRDNHNSSLLTKRFEEGEQFNELEYLLHGKELKLFDNQWLDLLEFIDRFFFYVEKIEEKGFVIVNNPRPFITKDIPESIRPSGVFYSHEDAQEEILWYVEKNFKFFKTFDLVGRIDEASLTEETHRLLEKHPEFTYIDTSQGFGGLFTSDLGLAEIEDGAKIILELLASLKDTNPDTTLVPFEIVKL